MAETMIGNQMQISGQDKESFERIGLRADVASMEYMPFDLDGASGV